MASVAHLASLIYWEKLLEILELLDPNYSKKFPRLRFNRVTRKSSIWRALVPWDQNFGLNFFLTQPLEDMNKVDFLIY